MGFSYDPTDLATELNALRFEIGDTDSNEPLLDDAEIAYIQAAEASFSMRASVCCEHIAAKFARDVKYKIDGFSEDAQDKYDRYIALAKKFAASASDSYPWAGSIVAADKERIEADTSLVKPRFTLGLDKNT